ncbi:MAG: RNA pseudouridine synthase, partial [Woeseiales bacterium]
MSRVETHIPIVSSDDNAVDLLHVETGHSKQRIKQAMSKGAVWLTRGKQTQRLRRAKRRLQAGDELHL